MKTKEEIEQLADIYGTSKDAYDREYISIVQRNSFIDAYTQCQEDMAEKKLDEDYIKEMALDFIINTGGLPKTIEEWQNALWKFYQSLNKQD
jgi:hypothetical protein